MDTSDTERQRIEKAYKSRLDKGWHKRYSLYQGGTLQAIQERERVVLLMLQRTVGTLADKRILDIGCGAGNTLIPFLLYGAKMEHCFGVDIIEERIETAKQRLPGMNFECCSGEDVPFERGTFDLVTMFTCLSSILDKEIRQKICSRAYDMLHVGGWVLIYDLRINNPLNSDVRAVTLKELKQYFQGCKSYTRTLTLVPQLGRALGAYSIYMCGVLAKIPFLRTHRMTIFQKPGI